MAFEMPLDQIKQLQISLRKDTNLSWYEPEKEEQFTLPKLLSVAEAIEKLDPSPPYLRCKNCKGKLLRDLQSFICVFCGTNPHKDLPPDPIKFKNTAGYRWLLGSLKLDGSEMVRPFVEGNESNRKKSDSKDEIPLSELLDLEIRWSSESERLPSSNSDEPAFQSKSAAHLVGVDIDSFFAPRESTSNGFEVQLDSNKHIDSAANNAFQVSPNLSLFQNAPFPETATGSTKDQGGDSFTGWEASFQSATSSGVLKEKSKYFDPSVADLDAAFGYGKDSVGVKKNDDLNPPASTGSDWFQGDIWRTSNSEVSSQTGKSEVFVNLDDTKTSESANSTSTKKFDWMQDDQWQGTSNKTTDNNTVDDSFDAWNDFRGSVSVQYPSTAFPNSEITGQTEKSEITVDLNDIKKAESGNDSSTKNFDWIQDGQWLENNNKTTGTATIDEADDSWNDFTGSASIQNPSSGVDKSSEITGQSGNSEMTTYLTDPKTAEIDNNSSMKNFDLFQGEQWEWSKNKTSGTVDTDKISFDAWNDFTSLTSGQDPSNNVWKHTVKETSSWGTSEMNLLGLSNNSRDMDFGSFSQQDLFGVDVSKVEASISDRVDHPDAVGKVAEDIEGADVFGEKLVPKVDEVEMLMAQMHDLSFMLESNLSVPQK
ncbi:hypothetical protein L6164_018865 [Bauhinia variegata]|uniref:Uncharacterized protein n=1 Tax=Bauhinia variegata TaxID=167791 RepID=A0ACB9NDT2_BAUVA|nr:hypothetical protein L6164_018865 [Bauhinia variegata]